MVDVQQMPLPGTADPVEGEPLLAPAVVQQVIPPVAQVMDVGKGSKLDPRTIEVLMRTNKFMIQQQASLLEAVTLGAFEASNMYSVYDENHNKLFEVYEESGCCGRCFCAPEHTFKLMFSVFNEDGTKGVDSMTMERTGWCAKPCLGCCVCCACCADSMKLHAGNIPGDVGELDQSNLIGVAAVPAGCGVCGGCCTPTVNVMDRGEPDEEPTMKVTGPCCFGGVSELCCSVPFQVTRHGEDMELGGLAQLSKVKPNNLDNALREAFTDADIYEMDIKEKNLSADQKAQLLGTLLLLDYMFFERDNDMCDPIKQEINCFNMYCCGCICPCKISYGKKNSG